MFDWRKKKKTKKQKIDLVKLNYVVVRINQNLCDSLWTFISLLDTYLSDGALVFRDRRIKIIIRAQITQEKFENYDNKWTKIRRKMDKRNGMEWKRKWLKCTWGRLNHNVFRRQNKHFANVNFQSMIIIINFVSIVWR